MRGVRADRPVSGIDSPMSGYGSVAERSIVARRRARSHASLSRRLIVAQAILLGAAVLIVVQLVRWQIVERKALLEGAAITQIRSVEVPPQRGLILDRNAGLLAFNSYEYTVFAAPNQIPEKSTAEVAAYLAPVIGWSVDDLIKQLSGEDLYAPIEHQVSLSVGKSSPITTQSGSRRRM